MTTDTGSRTSTDQQPRTTKQRTQSLGHDLPRVPRRYGQWAGAVLFVVMAVLLAGWFWQQKSDREEVLAVAHPVAAGTVIEADDLEVVAVAGVTSTISHEDAASVVGSTAAVGLVEGQILAPDMVTSKPLPGPGERVVGLQLDATRAPSGLLPGRCCRGARGTTCWRPELARRAGRPDRPGAEGHRRLGRSRRGSRDAPGARRPGVGRRAGHGVRGSGTRGAGPGADRG